MTDKNETLVKADPNHIPALAAVAREDIEVKAAILMARANPRSEAQARQNLITACARPDFAEDATYSFPRGGTKVEGPSVDLAREAARLWRNVHFGMAVISKDEDWIHVMGWAHDLESNVKTKEEDRFRRLIQRRRANATEWVPPDERDERELTNRRGQICVRNAILHLLPRDLINEAVAKALQTAEAHANKQLGENPDAAMKKLVDAFAPLGVDAVMLENRLRHPLALTTARELVSLRQVYKNLHDGVTKREDEFVLPKPPSEQGASTLEGIMGQVRQPS